MSAVNWLVSQPWPIFLALYLSPLALLTGLLITFAHHRQPPEPEPVWHGHECGCICTDKILPCDAHKGHAGAALHSRQEAP